MNISNEEMGDLFCEFIRYVYNEMQTKGWIRRRFDFRKQFNLIDNDFYDLEDELTISEMVEKYGDLNTVLINQFITEAVCVEWIDAYYYYLHPQMLVHRSTYRESIYSELGRQFNYWILTKEEEIILEELNNILFMDISLK